MVRQKIAFCNKFAELYTVTHIILNVKLMNGAAHPFYSFIHDVAPEIIIF